MLFTAGDVTPALVNELLTGSLPTAAEVTSITPAAVGTGQMGENVRFSLTWDRDDANLPASVIGKFPSDDPVSRATGLATRAYEREVFFYRHVADTVDIRTPQCFHADVDLETGDFVLLMEDLAPRVQGDQLGGCRPGEAESAVDELIALQAPRWDDESLHEHAWMSRRDPESVGGTAAIYGAVLDGFVAQIGPHMQPEHVDVARRLGTVIGEWLTGTPGPWTVTHGDYRLDNMLTHLEHRLTVVDWQTTGHGTPWTDLAYFLGTGLEPADRRQAESALFDRYLAGLGARGLEVDRAAAGEGVRRQSLAGLLMAVVASQIVVATERGDVMFAAMADRSAAMALDVDAFSLI